MTVREAIEAHLPHLQTTHGTISPATWAAIIAAIELLLQDLFPNQPAEAPAINWVQLIEQILALIESLINPTPAPVPPVPPTPAS